jgi:hypothetical protein
MNNVIDFESVRKLRFGKAGVATEVEEVTTRDAPFEDRFGGWGTRRVRPAGDGWRIAGERERATTWVRIIRAVGVRP